jgi:succinate-semialdehyde dehydrogenase/glutarate-semialdehyde dehydrogenase
MNIDVDRSAMKAAGQALIREAALIGGAWIAKGGDGAEAVHDPAAGARIGEIPKLAQAQIDEAIAAAARAFAPWAEKPGMERGAILARWNDLILQNASALGALLALENGKPFDEAVGEIRYAASFVHWFAGEAERIAGDVFQSPKPNERILTFKEPVGVVGAITPWNFPAAMVTRKVAPALAAGCTMVLKPASETPFTALALGALAQEAGAPDGVFNIVTGDAAMIGDVLTAADIVRKISFTGSTAIGRLLAGKSAATLKRVTLELGGAAPLIVFEDADLDKAVEGAVFSKFRNAGQTCVCPNRFYVHAAVRDAFLEKFAARVGALRVGAAFESGAEIGPVISPAGFEKVEAHLKSALAAGGRVIVGGKPARRGGLFFEPTVIAGADGGDELFRNEETFGPFAPVFGFKTEDEAIAAANATAYGLASYFFTENLGRGLRVARRLEAGIVGLNTGAISNAVNPFGGVKHSGYGREGSRYGIEDYLSVKSVTIAGA